MSTKSDPAWEECMSRGNHFISGLSIGMIIVMLAVFTIESCQVSQFDAGRCAGFCEARDQAAVIVDDACHCGDAALDLHPENSK